MLTSLESVPIVPLGMQNRLTCLTFPCSHSRTCSSENSCAPPPDPSTTPISRCCSSESCEVSIPACFSASAEAASARGTARETCLRSCASTHASSSKSCTSPAICTGKPLGSKLRMRFTPLLPARMALQNASLPIPLGLTTPMPVITTRFFIDGSSDPDLRCTTEWLACLPCRGIQDACPREIIVKDYYSRTWTLISASLLSQGLYISVPFCRTKCTFCNFASGVFSRALFDHYVAQVCAELEAGERISEALGGDFQSQVDSIYLGGGTPSVLAPDQLERLFGAVRDSFEIAPAAEITVECAPGTITDEVLEALVHCGVNRVSLGVQSFVDKECSSVGRLHTRAVTLADIARLRASGIGNISLDLIAGLPHQTEQSWDFSLGEALATGIPHISVYMLEVDEESRLGNELLAGGGRYHAHFVPDDDLTADLYLAACARLERGGVRQYEISNFARPVNHGIGLHDSRHNLKYWTRQPYLGFGVDAHSLLIAKDELRARGVQALRCATPDLLEGY